MKIFQWLRLAAMQSDDFKAQLFAFLGGDDTEFRIMGGKPLSRADARQLLQELIPAKVEVLDVCKRSSAVVAAAPHVSFDNWSEYFCNRAARQLGLGRVIARNYRDQDGHRIPVFIGRHVHVNRPTESNGPGKLERETERARAVHQAYLAALAEAGGRGKLPLDLLVEFHSHRRTPFLEIASVGLTGEQAERLAAVYEKQRQQSALLPELRIEPLHELRLTAEGAKQAGSLRAEVAQCALHIEVPREARRAEEFRAKCREAVNEMIESLLQNIHPCSAVSE